MDATDNQAGSMPTVQILQVGENTVIGRRFGRLVVQSEAPRKDKKHRRWDCLCDCGNFSEKGGDHLKSGHIQSCGCIKNEILSERNTTHGLAKTPTYKIWAGMKSRCTNPNVAHWGDYGGRGITVCDRWQYFSNFLIDMGERPEGMQIDRIDNDKGYFLGNCQWVSRSVNCRNTRTAVILSFNGETLNVTDWAVKTGIKAGTIFKRVKMGWDVTRILTTVTS